MIRIAVIADPHVHDCDWRPEGSGLGEAIRSFGETVASTRVFNESIPAFRAALSRAAEEGVKLVLLVGDLTDDGQAPHIEAALALIAEFREKHGIRVLAVPGNHDFYALTGRPQVKTLLTAEGAAYRLDSADCPEAATLGTEAALRRMQGLGYQPEAGDLHWESPFGRDPDWSARHYAVQSPDGKTSCRMIDASYLIEPVAGLWVLALDANVAVPRDGAPDPGRPESFTDPSGTGWTAVLAHRAHLFGWMRDVAARARAAGKELVAFSHYPLVDVLAGASEAEMQVFGAIGLARRLPPPRVAEAFAATGVGLHFSGHLHVNDTALYHGPAGRFCNIAVPSPVGFAPALKIVDLKAERVSIQTPMLEHVPGHDRAYPAYRAEARALGQAEAPAMHAPDHLGFMDRHLVELVHRRYLPREWPEDMAAFVRGGRMADLLAILGLEADLPDLPLPLLVEDWYRLRKAGRLAQRYIPPERLASYHRLCALLPATGEAVTGNSLAARFTAVLQILKTYLHHLPDDAFTLDLSQMKIEEM